METTLCVIQQPTSCSVCVSISKGPKTSMNGSPCHTRNILMIELIGQ